MRKIIAVTISLVLLLSVAIAEDTDVVIAKWNGFHKHYNSATLSKDNLINEDATQKLFAGDNWRIIFVGVDGNYEQIGIYAEDMETLLSNAATFGLCMVGDVKNFPDFLGRVVYMYFNLKAGERVIPTVYGSYTVSLSEAGNGVLLACVIL